MTKLIVLIFLLTKIKIIFKAKYKNIKLKNSHKKIMISIKLSFLFYRRFYLEFFFELCFQLKILKTLKINKKK